MFLNGVRMIGRRIKACFCKCGKASKSTCVEVEELPVAYTDIYHREMTAEQVTHYEVMKHWHLAPEEEEGTPVHAMGG